MKKYNIEELREKINRCKNIPLDEINPDDVDECLTNVLKNLYR